MGERRENSQIGCCIASTARRRATKRDVNEAMGGLEIKVWEGFATFMSAPYSTEEQIRAGFFFTSTLLHELTHAVWYCARMIPEFEDEDDLDARWVIEEEEVAS
jgi:hypothetical protein